MLKVMPNIVAASPSPTNGSNGTPNRFPRDQRIMWTPEEIVAFYGNYAAKYDEDIDANAATYPAPFVIGKWILDWLHLVHPTADSEGIKILDVGCGTGQSSAMFFQNTTSLPWKLEVHGIDTTEEVPRLQDIF
jgi:ubiquinone/menaquinone biosynthesis C-methylase UbiE